MSKSYSPIVTLVFLGGFFFFLFPSQALAQGSALPQVSSEAPLQEELSQEVVESLDRFTREFIWLEPGSPVGYSPTGEPLFDLDRIQPFQGYQARPLEGRELYLHLGEEELAGRYQRRLWTRRILRISSATLSLAGMVAPFVYLVFASRPAQTIAPVIISSAAAITVGSVLGIRARLMNPHPIEYNERYTLIEEHNRRLVQELDLYRDELPQFEILVPGLFHWSMGLRIGTMQAGVLAVGEF